MNICNSECSSSKVMWVSSSNRSIDDGCLTVDHVDHTGSMNRYDMMPKENRLDFDRPSFVVPRMFITISNSGANADYIKVVKPLRAIAHKYT